MGYVATDAYINGRQPLSAREEKGHWRVAVGLLKRYPKSQARPRQCPEPILRVLKKAKEIRL